jgi:hypothetical protein
MDVDTSPILRPTVEGEAHAARFTAAGRPGIVLRFAAFYGPDAPSTDQLLQLARRRMLPILGDGQRKTLHVRCAREQ